MKRTYILITKTKVLNITNNVFQQLILSGPE